MIWALATAFFAGATFGAIVMHAGYVLRRRRP